MQHLHKIMITSDELVIKLQPFLKQHAMIDSDQMFEEFLKLGVPEKDVWKVSAPVFKKLAARKLIFGTEQGRLSVRNRSRWMRLWKSQLYEQKV